MEPEVRQRAREQEEKGVGLGKHAPGPQDSVLCGAGHSLGKRSPPHKEVWAQNRAPSPGLRQ